MRSSCGAGMGGLEAEGRRKLVKGSCLRHPALQEVGTCARLCLEDASAALVLVFKLCTCQEPTWSVNQRSWRASSAGALTLQEDRPLVTGFSSLAPRLGRGGHRK